MSQPPVRSIYPINIPPIQVRSGLDVLLLELPGRYPPFMPNGLGFVHNIVKGMGVELQTLDLNIILYHRFHQDRILHGRKPQSKNGYEIKDDPWFIANNSDWTEEGLVDCFQDQIDEIVAQIVTANPRVMGISNNGLNRIFTQRVIQGVRKERPEMVIILGGHEWAHPFEADSIARKHDVDYIFIYEVDMTLEPVLRRILAGERPKDEAGVISRYDTPGRAWMDAPMIRDIDQLDFPRYDWFDDLSIYLNYEGFAHVPVAWSRGCRWSRCTFCAERFKWRTRLPADICEELEWFVARGFRVFGCNESDLIGDPDTLLAICDEIIRRGIHVQFTGQLRTHKRATPEFFAKLRQAGFIALRFGVDGWSDRALRLQMKGSNMKIVERSLRSARMAGIETTANVVIGVPGETEEDIQEMVENIARLSPYINSIENINTLMLVNGGVYYEHPEQFKIRFRGDKDEIYKKYPRMIPNDLWYSEEPYIDQEVRRQRLARLCSTLHRKGIQIGIFADVWVQKLFNEGKDAQVSEEEWQIRYMEKKWQSYEDRASASDKIKALLFDMGRSDSLDAWLVQALPQLETIMAEHPESFEARCLLANIRLGLHQYEAAIENYQEVFLYDVDTNPEIYNEFAFALTHLGRFEAAENAYHTALSVDETNPIAKQGLNLLQQFRLLKSGLSYGEFLSQSQAPSELSGLFGPHGLRTPPRLYQLATSLIGNSPRQTVRRFESEKVVSLLLVHELKQDQMLKEVLGAYLSETAPDSRLQLVIYSADPDIGDSCERLIETLGHDLGQIPDIVILDQDYDKTQFAEVFGMFDGVIVPGSDDAAVSAAVLALALDKQVLCLKQTLAPFAGLEDLVFGLENLAELGPLFGRLEVAANWKPSPAARLGALLTAAFNPRHYLLELFAPARAEAAVALA
ncbi:MAG: radical SAM protein [Candidatus Sericytochromatia bacterium]